LILPEQDLSENPHPVFGIALYLMTPQATRSPALPAGSVM
jgi:hypothetical protein